MEINEPAKKIIKLGGIVVGTTAGTAMALATANPYAIIAGTALGSVLPEVINDCADRYLSSREKVKIGAVQIYALSKIKEHIDRETPINIDFTVPISESSRTPAAELYEGIVIKAKNAFQEKKIKHIANVYGNSVFTEGVTPEDSNHVLSALEGLTYRKLCLISLYGRKESILNGEPLMRDSYLWYSKEYFHITLRSILQDIFELTSLGILDVGNSLIVNHLHLAPDNITLSKLGKKYYELMGLDEINDDEVILLAEELKYKDIYGVSSNGTINGVYT